VLFFIAVVTIYSPCFVSSLDCDQILSASGGLGFAPDGRDLLSAFVLSILSILEYCTKFGKLILAKIIKIVANRCQILLLKCTGFNFGWGSAYSAPRSPSWCYLPLPKTDSRHRPLGPLYLVLLASKLGLRASILRSLRL